MAQFDGLWLLDNFSIAFLENKIFFCPAKYFV